MITNEVVPVGDGVAGDVSSLEAEMVEESEKTVGYGHKAMSNPR